VAHVVILTHPYDAFESRPTFLREMAAVWREQGLPVTVCTDSAQHVDADLAVLHVDLTVVPPDYLAFVRRYPVAVNGRVTDISKRRISRNLVRRGDGYDGPVIVKTDRNYGGKAEAYATERGRPLARCAYALRQRLPWAWRAHIPSSGYRVFDSAARVPWAVWRNRHLVVERFLPERGAAPDEYGLRTWVFMGDRETNSICYSRHPIVKSDNILRREPVADVPDELRGMRRDLGFDFGKFDYALVDGRVVLYDANRTPSLGAFTSAEVLPRIRHLAEGIRAFL
jgi:hypothetical protein